MVVKTTIKKESVQPTSLYIKLKACVENSKQGECELTSKEKVELFKARELKEPDYSYETPFTWGDIVVNTNWLSLAFPTTIVYSAAYYKTLTPIVNY